MTAETASGAVVPATGAPNVRLLRLSEAIAIPVGALLASAAIFSIFLVVIGKDPVQFWSLVWTGGFGSSGGI